MEGPAGRQAAGAAAGELAERGVWQRIASLLSSLQGDNPQFPPTLIYNEGWLLRLAPDWFARQEEIIGWITSADQAAAETLGIFYQRCLAFAR